MIYLSQLDFIDSFSEGTASGSAPFSGMSFIGSDLLDLSRQNVHIFPTFLHLHMLWISLYPYIRRQDTCQTLLRVDNPGSKNMATGPKGRVSLFYKTSRAKGQCPDVGCSLYALMLRMDIFYPYRPELHLRPQQVLVPLSSYKGFEMAGVSVMQGVMITQPFFYAGRLFIDFRSVSAWIQRKRLMGGIWCHILHSE